MQLYISAVRLSLACPGPQECATPGAAPQAGNSAPRDPLSFASLGAGTTLPKLQLLQALLLCLCPLHTARDHKWTQERGNFLTKRGSCWKEERGTATPELAPPPANRPQRRVLGAGIREAQFKEEISVIINVSAFPSAGVPRNQQFLYLRWLVHYLG